MSVQSRAEMMNPGTEPEDRLSLDWALWHAQMCVLASLSPDFVEEATNALHWLGELRAQRGGIDAGWEDDSLVRSCEVWIRG